ncbi:MAG: IPT/TIG domain-containing protein, partial [Methanoregula sp.]|uniref:IPT/TIG domain-containing protein n=1 Tax=Methanoregula sp. TaxID=2052170 RepID=UPI003D102E81
GGTIVSISGSGFTGVTAVNFGQPTATSYTFNNDTSITATSPPSSNTGAVDITVVTPGGTSATSAADRFTYVLPTVTGISPPNGTTLGGTVVSISGTAFTGVTAVKFGSTPATSYTFNNDTSITAIAPAGTGTIDITVITPGGTSATSASDRFTYVLPPVTGISTAPPIVTGISPANGTILGGTSVSISGTAFTGVTAVKFGSTPATSYTFNNDTSITTIAPAGNGTIDITVITPGGTSATSAAGKFTYVTPAQPVVTGISPANGTTLGGTSVSISGSTFTGVTAVKFGSIPMTLYSFNNDTSITAIAPAGNGTVDITVIAPVGTSATSAADKFTYIPAPAPSIEIIINGTELSWTLNPATTFTENNVLHVVVNSTAPWTVAASDADTTDTNGFMTDWTGSAYVTSIKLANALQVNANGGIYVTLPTGGPIVTGTAGTSPVTYPFGFQQKVSYADPVLRSPNEYRIVVTLIGTTV